MWSRHLSQAEERDLWTRAFYSIVSEDLPKCSTQTVPSTQFLNSKYSIYQSVVPLLTPSISPADVLSWLSWDQTAIMKLPLPPRPELSSHLRCSHLWGNTKGIFNKTFHYLFSTGRLQRSVPAGGDRPKGKTQSWSSSNSTTNSYHPQETSLPFLYEKRTKVIK